MSVGYIRNIVANTAYHDENYIRTRNSKKLTKEDAEDIRELYEMNISTSEIAKTYDISMSHVRNIVANEDHYDENYSPPEPKLTDEHVAEIRDLYNNKKVSSSELAEQYGLSVSYVNKLINNENRVDDNYVRTVFPDKVRIVLSDEDVKNIRHLYNHENKSYEDLAKEYGITLTYIRKLVENKKRVDNEYVRTRLESNVATKKASKPKKEKKEEKIDMEAAKKIREYYDFYGWSFKYFSELYKTSVNSIRSVIDNKICKDPTYVRRRFK
jgi:DNA invertase Pin-like site-specific DNA recombinase